jgi:hypothetical protein
MSGASQPDEAKRLGAFKMAILILTVITKAGTTNTVRFACDSWESAELKRRSLVRRGNLNDWQQITSHRIEFWDSHNRLPISGEALGVVRMTALNDNLEIAREYQRQAARSQAIADACRSDIAEHNRKISNGIDREVKRLLTYEIERLQAVIAEKERTARDWTKESREWAIE